MNNEPSIPPAPASQVEATPQPQRPDWAATYVPAMRIFQVTTGQAHLTLHDVSLEASHALVAIMDSVLEGPPPYEFKDLEARLTREAAILRDARI